MSATNRGAERHPRDFYPTPSWCVDRLLDELCYVLPTHDDATWLEPAVGEGHIVRAVRKWHGGSARGVRWTTCDVERPKRSGAPRFIHGDYLKHELPRAGFDIAITNPPFILDEAFVTKMRRDAAVAIALLRLDWLASAERNAYVRRHPPDVYVIPDRPSFTGNGESDSQTYAWFVWGLGSGREYKVLETTPLEERKAAA